MTEFQQALIRASKRAEACYNDLLRQERQLRLELHHNLEYQRILEELIDFEQKRTHAEVKI
jgi:hypothetical protein